MSAESVSGRVPEAEEWARLRGIGPPAPSRRGARVPGLAAGWLYLAEVPGVGFVDGLVSNPAAGPREVSRAVDEVVALLERAAARAGVRLLVCLTQRRSVAQRAARLGYAPAGAYMALQKGI